MKKTITFELEAITVEVNVPQGASKEETLNLGKKALIKQISTKFPYYKYGITEGTVIDDTDVLCGRPVRLKESGKISIIYDIKPGTKFPIRLSIEGGKLMDCTKSAIEKVSKKTSIDKLIKGRQAWEKESNEWHKGKTAFFVNGEELKPVIIGTTTRGKTNVYPISHESTGSYYPLPSSSLVRLFDTKQEAETYLEKLKQK